MTTTVQRLRILDLEATSDWVGHPGPAEENALDGERVAFLLSGESERAQPLRDRDPAAVIDSADERDALVGMRGVMIGFALMVPFWALVAAVFVLA